MKTIVETMNADKKYGGWLWAVKLIGKGYRVFTDNTQLCPKSWRVYYDEGLSPLDAIKEDFKHQK